MSLIGLPEEARRAVGVHRDDLSLWPHWSRQQAYWRRAFAHAYEGAPMNLETEADGSRWSLLLGYNTMGFAALGRGDRETARAFFRKADEHPPLLGNDYVVMRAVRARLLTDPNWPPWIKNPKK